jgi:hypothetical protein
MRTTVMFAPELMRMVKARSAERGESLKTWLTRAVQAELGRDAAAPAAQRRLTLPLFGAGTGGSVRLSNADLERALAEADAAGIESTPHSRRARRRIRAPR